MSQRLKYTRTDSCSEAASQSVPPTPNVPIRSAVMPQDTWSEGKRFGGREVPLGVLGGAEQVGVNLMELAPGKQSCPFHWHLREEEHFFVLHGRCVLRSGDDRFVMEPGDYVCFPAGTRVGHAFENPFAEACQLMAIGTRDADEIAVYPDSGKAKLRALGHILRYPSDTLDYWDDELVDVPIGHGHE